MADLLLGIDLGTSSVRAGLFDRAGNRLGLGAMTYPILTPEPDAAEQDPREWWRATCTAIRSALGESGQSGADIAAISLSGQMHGSVLLDRDGQPVHPAITWADRRSSGVLGDITERIGEQRIERMLMNRPFAGTQAATVAWLMHDRTPVWKQVRHLLTPKDYLRYRLCGLYNTEPSDASGTLLCDVGLREWSEEVLQALGIPLEFLPFMVNSDQHIADTDGIEDETGIPDGVPVVLGGSDQACAALGNGIVDGGSLLITIGTGGQLLAPLHTAEPSPNLTLHTFCHLPRKRWFRLGASLAGGLCLSWFRDTFHSGATFDSLSEEASTVPTGADGLSFLPYLQGRRMPKTDSGLAGAFQGIRTAHGRGHFVRAVMEGVVFEIRELYDLMKASGGAAERIVASGGFINSQVWLQILADNLGTSVEVAAGSEQAVFGAALTAGVGIGWFDSFTDAARLVPPVQTVIEPDEETASMYRERYEAYRSIVG